MNYILVDTANTFFRARHVIKGALNEKIGMALHITLNIFLIFIDKNIIFVYVMNYI